MLDSDKSMICLQACREALYATQHCAAECIKYGWRKSGRHLSLICLDAADACAGAINVLARGSIHHREFCAFCAHLCLYCAEQCDNYMIQNRRSRCASACVSCAQACRSCADVCRRQSGDNHFLVIKASCHLKAP